MFDDLGRDLAYLRFRHACRDLARTGPLTQRKAALEVVTLLSHRDVTLYLIAIKTLYRQIPGGGITIINDGSLTREDFSLLTAQLPGAIFVSMSSIDSSPCPKGSCWERLMFVVDRCRDTYVIQMDSDTLTLGNVEEIAHCVSSNESFVLGTGAGQRLLSPAQSSALAENMDSNHIQVRAERILPQATVHKNAAYVRGCAGFAGFARGEFSRRTLVEFSTSMERLLGNRWHEWGSEQVASNYLIANSPRAAVLPFPKYSCFEGSLDPAAVFLHFYGTYRFKNSAYQRLARRSVASLREPGGGIVSRAL